MYTGCISAWFSTFESGNSFSEAYPHCHKPRFRIRPPVHISTCISAYNRCIKHVYCCIHVLQIPATTFPAVSAGFLSMLYILSGVGWLGKSVLRLYGSTRNARMESKVDSNRCHTRKQNKKNISKVEWQHLKKNKERKRKIKGFHLLRGSELETKRAGEAANTQAWR